MLFDSAMRYAGFANQKELAERLRTDFGTVNRWRCGRRPVPHWLAIVFELLRDPDDTIPRRDAADLIIEGQQRR